MVAKAKLIERSAKAELKNAALSEALKKQAAEFGVILAASYAASQGASDMFRKASVALTDMQAEHKIGKLSDGAAMYIETIGRSAWHEIHKHLGKAAPQYARGNNSTINMGLMKLTKISKALSVDGYITNEKTDEKWAVKAHMLDLLGKDRGFNAAVQFAYEVNRRHDWLCLNDLPYAQAVGYVEPSTPKTGRPSNKKASDRTVNLVSEKVRVMDAEQCYAVLANAAAQLAMFVSPTDPGKINAMQRISGLVKETEVAIRAILTDSAKGGRVLPPEVPTLETPAPVGTIKPKRTGKPKVQPEGVTESVAA